MVADIFVVPCTNEKTKKLIPMTIWKARPGKSDKNYFLLAILAAKTSCF